MFGFGTMPLFTKLAIEGGASALVVALLSAVVAAVAAISVRGMLTATPMSALLRLRILGSLAVVGVLSAGLVMLLGALALEHTSATNRSLFHALYPFATAGFAWLLLGERLRPSHYWLMALAAIGLFLTNRGATGLELGYGFWLLAATLPIIGFCDAYSKRRLVELSPATLTAGRFLFGALFLFAIVPFTASSDWHYEPRVWAMTVLAGLASVTGVTGLYRAMTYQTATLAAMFASLSPLVTVVLEWALLDAHFYSWQLAGIALVVVAAVWLAHAGQD